MSGWIKIHREIEGHWVFQRPDYFRAWMLILLRVNHKENSVMIGGELMKCDRGEALYSLDTWRSIFGKGWTVKRVRTFFKLLQRERMIETKGERKTTRLRVCKYDTYQSEGQTKGRQRASKGQQLKNDKNVKNEYLEELEGFIFYFNEVRGTKYKPVESLLKNFAHWRGVYSVEEMGQAVKNCHDGSWLDSDLSPTKLLRTKNKNGECDYIGELLNLKPKPIPGML